MDLVNKSRKKLGTLTGSTCAQTVHATTADRPALGPDRPPGHFGAQHMPPAFWRSLSEPKSLTQAETNPM
jgi:hypothetical protein